MALAGLAPYLKGKLFLRGLNAALNIRIDDCKAEAIAGFLAPQPSLALLKIHLKSQAFFDSAERNYREEVFSRLARKMDQDGSQQRLKSILAMEEEQKQTVEVSSLGAEVEDALLQYGLEATQSFSDSLRWRVVQELMPWLHGDLLWQGLDVTLAIEDEERRAEALAMLSSHLTGKLSEKSAAHRSANDLLSQILEAAKKIGNDRYRVQVLSSLIPRLNEDLIQYGLKIALTFEPRTQLQTLRIILPFVVDQPSMLRSIQRLVVDYLTILHNEDRDAVLCFLQDEIVCEPSALNIPTETLIEIANYTIEICREWEWYIEDNPPI